MESIWKWFTSKDSWELIFSFVTAISAGILCLYFLIDRYKRVSAKLKRSYLGSKLDRISIVIVNKSDDVLRGYFVSVIIVNNPRETVWESKPDNAIFQPHQQFDFYGKQADLASYFETRKTDTLTFQGIIVLHDEKIIRTKRMKLNKSQLVFPVIEI